MKVWILQTGEPLQIDNNGLRPMRAINLSQALTAQGHQVTLWSSDFDHFTKQHRFGTEKTIEVSGLLTIRLIKSRGYKSHIGIGRLLDHVQLGWNLKKMLKHETAPDVSFIGYPPIEPAWVLTRWLNKHNSPSILDIKDAWPDNLVDAFPISLKPLARIFFHPYFIMMKESLTIANGVSSISPEFIDWCLLKAGRTQNRIDFVFPLSSQSNSFSKEEIAEATKWWNNYGVSKTNVLRGYFVGSLTSAFDFEPIIKAAKELPVSFVIAGDGPRLQELRNKVQKLPNLMFPGRISSVQAQVLSSLSDFSLAPLAPRSDFEMSIPNKFYDAMQMGKPMITSLDGPARRLIEEHNCGLFYSTHSEFTDLLIMLIKDADSLTQMSQKALSGYKKEFDYSKVYGNAVKRLFDLQKSDI
jgi:glycosyltransferase involved in cell wall biosynthesis